MHAPTDQGSPKKHEGRHFEDKGTHHEFENTASHYVTANNFVLSFGHGHKLTASDERER